MQLERAVGKSSLELERSIEVGKLPPTLENSIKVEKKMLKVHKSQWNHFPTSNFPTSNFSNFSFQLHVSLHSIICSLEKRPTLGYLTVGDFEAIDFLLNDMTKGSAVSHMMSRVSLGRPQWTFSKTLDRYNFLLEISFICLAIIKWGAPSRWVFALRRRKWWRKRK